MKNRLLFISVLILAGCSPKLSSQIKENFRAILREIDSPNSDITELQSRFPEFSIVEKVLTDSEVETKREISAIGLGKNERTDIITNEDESCGIIKVKEIRSNARMRVSYIYLNDETSQGEELADLILEEHGDGTSFVELAREHSKDGNAEKGGDLGWFDEKMMIKDFTEAIRNHNYGDVFKVRTRQYGWYVIFYSHQFEERREFDIIEIEKEGCG